MEAKNNETSKNTPKKAEKPESVETYTFSEFVANHGVLGASADIVSAALTEKGIKETTIENAKKIVTEFKERKVE